MFGSSQLWSTSICVLALITTLAGSSDAPDTSSPAQLRYMSRADATAVQLELKMTSGTLHIRGGASKLLDATFSGNTQAPRFLYVERGSAGYGQIYQSLEAAPLFGVAPDDWTLKLSDQVLFGCLLTLGTGKADVDLRSLWLMRLTIKGNADELKLDLRNIRTSGLTVVLLNAPGVTTVYLPDHLGVQVRTKNPLIETEGPLQHIGTDWVNAAYGISPVTISILIDEEAGPVRLIAS